MRRGIPMNNGTPAPRKRYHVTLTSEERRQLETMLGAGRSRARDLAHARILLKADESPEG
jgi:hypothetical protein